MKNHNLYKNRLLLDPEHGRKSYQNRKKKQTNDLEYRKKRSKIKLGAEKI